MACSADRYTATYVVAPQLGPPDCQVADFTDLQSAVAALPSTGGKIFVKAGTYPITSTVQIGMSNVQIQGEGMGITKFVADAGMTASPVIEVNNPGAGSPLTLLADTPERRYEFHTEPAGCRYFECFRLYPAVLEQVG